ncbi:MAG: hypothetical protein IPF67_02255 [Saprospiraceae bacterium]|nr:hypothetical protein [Candidatus Brachybacter algidus]
MEITKSKVVGLEVLWILVAVIIAAIVITPIYFNAEHFPFYWTNGIFVFAFITYTRLMFFINSSMLTLHVSVKLFFLATAVPFTFLLIDMFNDFQVYLDNNGQKQISMEIYLRNEILLFGVGAIITSIIFPVFIVISIWRFRNRGRHI